MTTLTLPVLMRAASIDQIAFDPRAVMQDIELAGFSQGVSRSFHHRPAKTPRGQSGPISVTKKRRECCSNFLSGMRRVHPDA
jgi:hypothetical protein